MKFGVRAPSLKGRISARTSLKRVVRHKIGLKAPRGFGITTNPKKFAYNKVYHRTSVSVDRLLKISKRNSGSLEEANKREMAGNIAARDGKIDEAITLFKEAKSIDHKRAEIDWKIGGLLNNEGRFKEAIPYLEENLKNNIDNNSAKVILSNCYVRTPDYSKAVPLLQSIPENEPEFPKAMQLLSSCFEKDGKVTIAIDVLNRAVVGKRKMDDQMAETHYNLGVLYNGTGDTNKAKTHLEKVYEYRADFLDTAEMLGKVSK
jgi:tetratricopeptide (TPR) repeat protein